jgi:hypothetical protein
MLLMLSYPFAERLIGTIRREYLDRTLFWMSVDLEDKLLEFRNYYKTHRTHTSLEGRTPDQDTSVSWPFADLHSCRWPNAANIACAESARKYELRLIESLA